MPDHMHLLWIGTLDRSDQRVAAKFFRKQINLVLKRLEVRLQRQPYDRVLREDERTTTACEDVVEYIARNPERAGLVKPDAFREYPYSGCLVPGYPELKLWTPDSWERFWRAYSYLRTNGLVRGGEG